MPLAPELGLHAVSEPCVDVQRGVASEAHGRLEDGQLEVEHKRRQSAEIKLEAERNERAEVLREKNKLERKLHEINKAAVQVQLSLEQAVAWATRV